MEKVDYIYYINLKHRTDRDEQMRAELKTLGLLTAERFNAIKHAKGEVGCGRSHIGVLKLAASQLESTPARASPGAVMVLEDDTQFLVDRTTLDKYVEVFLADPNAHILCLGHNDQRSTDYNEYFCRTTLTFCANCYVVKQDFIPILVANFEEAVKFDETSIPIDVSWHKLQKDYIFLVPKKPVAIQRCSHSDIVGKKVNYGLPRPSEKLIRLYGHH
jgi:hypothetical protein